MDEVLSQFGGSTPQRQAVTARLQRIYQLASATGKLTRLVIFGSYVTTKPNPNAVDVIPDIEQVLRKKKPFILRCMLDSLKKLQGRVVTWNRFASSVSIT
jgi:hypothetical protein